MSSRRCIVGRHHAFLLHLYRGFGIGLVSPFHPIFSNSFGSRRGTNEIEGRSGGSRGSYRFGPRVLGYNGSDEPSRRFTDWYVFCIQHMHRLSQIHGIAKRCDSQSQRYASIKDSKFSCEFE